MFTPICIGDEAHKFWRIVMLASDGEMTGIGEIEMRAYPGGPDQCTGGTPGASSSYSTNTPDKAFDGVQGAQGWATQVNSGVGEYIYYEFATPVSVSELFIYSANSVVYWPTSIDFDWSDNGTNWTNRAALATGLTGVGQSVTLNVA